MLAVGAGLRYAALCQRGEDWVNEVVADLGGCFSGHAIRGMGWRRYPASVGCILLTATQESRPVLHSSAVASPGVNS